MNIRGKGMTWTCRVAALLTVAALAACGSSDDGQSSVDTGAGAGIIATPQQGAPSASTAPSTAPPTTASTPEPVPTSTVITDFDRELYPEVGNVTGVVPTKDNDAVEADNGDKLACDPSNYMAAKLSLDDGTITIYGTPVRTSKSGQGDEAVTTISAIGRTSPYAVIVNGNQAARILPEGSSAVTKRLMVKLTGKDWGGSIKKVTLCVGGA